MENKFNKMNWSQDIVDRFWSKVKFPENIDDCWEWTAYKDRDGYGHFTIINNKVIRASRFAYEFYNGPIPNGLLVCHKCDNPPCCNPNHLFLGTIRENSIDMLKKGRAPIGDKDFGKRTHGKIIENDVEDILHLKYDTVQTASQCLGIHQHAVRAIFQRKSWQSITDRYSDDELNIIKNKLHENQLEKYHSKKLSKAILDESTIKLIKFKLNNGERIVDISKNLNIARYHITDIKYKKVYKYVE
jgi:hypothetical protein